MYDICSLVLGWRVKKFRASLNRNDQKLHRTIFCTWYEGKRQTIRRTTCHSLCLARQNRKSAGVGETIRASQPTPTLYVQVYEELWYTESVFEGTVVLQLPVLMTSKIRSASSPLRLLDTIVVALHTSIYFIDSSQCVASHRIASTPAVSTTNQPAS